MDPEETKTVRWYTCDCDWVTNYCEMFHTARSRVPVSVLDQYRVTVDTGDAR